jgi:hypothetical protein
MTLLRGKLSASPLRRKHHRVEEDLYEMVLHRPVELTTCQELNREHLNLARNGHPTESAA